MHILYTYLILPACAHPHRIREYAVTKQRNERKDCDYYRHFLFARRIRRTFLISTPFSFSHLPPPSPSLSLWHTDTFFSKRDKERGGESSEMKGDMAEREGRCDRDRPQAQATEPQTQGNPFLQLRRGRRAATASSTGGQGEVMRGKAEGRRRKFAHMAGPPTRTSPNLQE